MEACPSAHHWAREIGKLGHEVKLMAPQYVKPYVKTNKNDAADAEAICEAVTRPTMRFVPVKSTAQQSILIIHRTRHLLIRQRTQLINALRGHLAEFGIVAAKGICHVRDLIGVMAGSGDDRLPPFARDLLGIMVRQLDATQLKITELDRTLVVWARTNDVCRRLQTIPGVGAIISTALVASIGDPAAFKNGRNFAAWLGLVPKQYSTGGRDKLGSISKRGDAYLRTLLVHGSRSVLRWRRSTWLWLEALLRRRPVNVAVLAIANKMARIAWVLMHKGGVYETPTPAQPA
jgi:transposase